MKKINIEKQDSVKLYKIRKTLEELSQKSGLGGINAKAIPINTAYPTNAAIFFEDPSLLYN